MIEKEKCEIVSIREFSRRVGISDTAVRIYYLDTLKIPMDARTVSKGGQPRLYYELAKAAYLSWVPTATFDESGKKSPEPVIEKKPRVSPNKGKIMVATPKPEQTKQNTGSVTLSERIHFSKGTKAATPEPEPETEEDETDAPEPDTKKQKVRDIPAKEPTEMDVGKLEILESERRTKSAAARIKEMELLEKQGKLVDKQKQEKTLFQFGIQIRDKIMSIPQRIIDQIRAADTRNEAELILTVELNKALKELAEFKES